MKKISFLTLSLLAATLFTGCIENYGNSFRGTLGYGTVVGKTGGESLINVDTGSSYGEFVYYKSDDNTYLNGLATGDRLYINSAYIDYDNQKGTGSQKNPYIITETHASECIQNEMVLKSGLDENLSYKTIPQINYFSLAYNKNGGIYAQGYYLNVMITDIKALTDHYSSVWFQMF